MTQAVFHLIGGPNGAGKSTLIKRLLAKIQPIDTSLISVNADEIAKTYVAYEQRFVSDTHNIVAARAAEFSIQEVLKEKSSLLVETVMSSDKYRGYLLEAKKHGYLVKVYYLCLENAEAHVERVTRRVGEGGHSVPEDKIRSRYSKSQHQFAEFFGPESDHALLLKSLDDQVLKVATIHQKQMIVHAEGHLSGLVKMLRANPDLKEVSQFTWPTKS